MKRLLCALAVISFFFMALPSPAQAVTTTLTVDGDGTTVPFRYYAPVPVVGGTFVNMQSDDGDTTAAYYQGDWSFSACTATAINSVTITASERSNIATSTSPEYKFYVVIGGVKYYASSSHTVYNDVIYRNYTYTWTTNPATGVAWTAADINAATFGDSYTAGAQAYISYVILTVDFVATAPSVTTSSASSIGVTTATLNGAITSLNGAASCDYEGFVWGTTSHSTITDNVTPPNGYTDNWTTSGTFTVASFSHVVTGLTSPNTYYVRAFAHSAYGWSYGSEVSFTVIYTPSITTVAASSIATTTARLNAVVVDYGQQLCDVQFAYDNVTRATFAAYANKTTLASDNFTTGNTPYADITGLTGATTYYFRVQITNDAGSASGSELTFATYNAVSAPSSITPISTGTTVSLVWIKGSGSNMTLVRYKAGSYPTSSSDGTLAYLGTGESVMLTGLTPGTTYYFIAYGFTSGVYSSSSATALCTTAAYDSSTTSTSSLTAPTADSTWTQTPSSAKTSTIPVFGGLIQGVSDSYHQPVNYVWYFAWMLAAVGIGIAVYIKGGFNIILGVGAMIGVIGIGVWWYNVITGGVVILLAIIAVGWALVGLRRPGG